MTATGSGISDADIVRAAQFLFARAEELGSPAVLNLSLGSNFGAHDGSSALERALSELIGPDQPHLTTDAFMDEIDSALKRRMA